MKTEVARRRTLIATIDRMTVEVETRRRDLDDGEERLHDAEERLHDAEERLHDARRCSDDV